MSPRHYLALTALAAALSLLPGCTTTHGPKGGAPAPGAGESAGNAEPDLLQTLRDRIAHGNVVHKQKAKETTEASATADTSKNSATAAAAGSVVLTPQQQKELAAVSADYSKALGLMHDGKNDDALTLLQSIVSRAPDFSGPMVNQGLILLQQQQYDRAERVLRRATVINPKSAYAFNILGIVLRNEGKFADAKTSYESALAIDPNYARAHFNLGVLADLYLQDLPLALTHYQAYQALQCKPDKAVANWIIDLQRRTGTTPAAGATAVAPAPTIDCSAPAPTAASGTPAALASSGSPAALAGSGLPAASAVSGPTPAASGARPAPAATSGKTSGTPAATITSGPATPPATLNAAPATSALPKPATSTGAK